MKSTDLSIVRCEAQKRSPVISEDSKDRGGGDQTYCCDCRIMDFPEWACATPVIAGVS